MKYIITAILLISVFYSKAQVTYFDSDTIKVNNYLKLPRYAPNYTLKTNTAGLIDTMPQVEITNVLFPILQASLFKISTTDSAASRSYVRSTSLGYDTYKVPYTGALRTFDLNGKVFRNWYLSKTSDSTAKVLFDASGISTAQSRTYTLQDKAGTLAFTSNINDSLNNAYYIKAAYSRFGTVSNNTSTEADGTVVLNGTATVWEDLQTPFETGENAGTGYPTFVPDSSYYTFVVDTTGVSKCILYFTVQMPHSWKEGSTIYPHVHYKHETGVGTPNFRLKYKWYALSGTTAKGWSYYNMTSTTGTTNNTNQMSYGSGGISGTGFGISSILIIQLYLSGTPANVNAYTFDIHYEMNTIGSRTETSK